MAHRKRRRGQPTADQEARRQEILNSPIGTYSPQIRSLLDNIPNMSEAEMLEAKLVLDEVIRGTQSLKQDPTKALQLERMREEVRARDKAVENYDKDPTGFINDAYERALRQTMPTNEKRAELQAQAASLYQEARTLAVATNATNRLAFEEWIRIQPEEMITIGPKYQLTSNQGMPSWVQVPIEIRMKHMAWQLWPGTYKVPTPVADAYRLRLLKEAEQAAIDHSINVSAKIQDARRGDIVFGQDWPEIARKYGSGMYIPSAAVVGEV